MTQRFQAEATNTAVATPCVRLHDTLQLNGTTVAACKPRGSLRRSLSGTMSGAAMSGPITTLAPCRNKVSHCGEDGCCVSGKTGRGDQLRLLQP